MSADDVVITGLGILTALGQGVAENLAAIEADRTAVTDLPDAPAGSPRARGARMNEPRLRIDVPEEFESQLKFLNPAGKIGLGAALEAMSQAGFPERFAHIAPGRRSLYLAQVDDMDWDCRTFRPAYIAAAPTDGETWDSTVVNKQSIRRTKPFFLLENLKNNVFSLVTQWFELEGPNTSVAGIGHAGFQALARAARAVADGTTDLALVLGAGSLTEGVSRSEMSSLGLVDGGPEMVPGDGAGAVVLERRASAEARGAEVLATWRGSAARSGPYDDHRPASSTVGAALEAAGVPARLDGIGVPVAFDPSDADPRTPDHRPFERAVGHLGPAMDPVDLVLSVVSANPGETWGVLSYGLFGQVGAIVVEKAP